MNLCNNGHEEVCFENRQCPCCDVISEKDKEITDLNRKIEVLEADLEDLQNSEA